MKKFLTLLVPAIVALTGCHEFGGGVRGGSSHHYPAGNLPPAHAPAHGRRAQQYRYYYYPEARYYFDIGRSLYFYLDSRGGWSVSARFPSHLHRYRDSHYVEIEMDIDRPYHRHNDHRKKYPPGHMKKKYKHNKKHKKKKSKGKDDDSGSGDSYRLSSFFRKDDSDGDSR